MLKSYRVIKGGKASSRRSNSTQNTPDLKTDPEVVHWERLIVKENN